MINRKSRRTILTTTPASRTRPADADEESEHRTESLLLGHGNERRETTRQSPRSARKLSALERLLTLSVSPWCMPSSHTSRFVRRCHGACMHAPRVRSHRIATKPASPTQKLSGLALVWSSTEKLAYGSCIRRPTGPPSPSASFSPKVAPAWAGSLRAGRLRPRQPFWRRLCPFRSENAPGTDVRGIESRSAARHRRLPRAPTRQRHRLRRDVKVDCERGPFEMKSLIPNGKLIDGFVGISRDR